MSLKNEDKKYSGAAILFYYLPKKRGEESHRTDLQGFAELSEESSGPADNGKNVERVVVFTPKSGLTPERDIPVEFLPNRSPSPHLFISFTDPPTTKGHLACRTEAVKEDEKTGEKMLVIKILDAADDKVG